MQRATVLVMLCVVLAACGGTMRGGYQTYLAKQGVHQPVTSQSFPHCHGYGCRIVSPVSFDAQDWQAVEQPFHAVTTAAEERMAIARSLALFEQRVGAHTGTAADVAGTYTSLGDDQLDCVDESVNSTVYLAALAQRGRLRYHDVGTPTARLFFTSLRLGPHQTAVITERDSGARFAVDSWFHDNGHAAEIVPMDAWMRGWRP